MAQYTMEQYAVKMKDWMRKGPRAAMLALRKEMMQVVGYAQEMHLSGPKMARGMGHPTLATLAAPTGRLRGSVTIDPPHMSHGSILTGIGSNVPYGRVHELGLVVLGVKMPERPWARPSIEARRKFIVKALLKAYMRAHRKAR